MLLRMIMSVEIWWRDRGALGLLCEETDTWFGVTQERSTSGILYSVL